ncbi:SGNH/GDSL hydrolase family protein [Sphingomicrobium aestuariivivum]|uniref:SGNH/GDSL hydrolase family protein n=1 Tax=Sphingomicrobium aestuariivivum TaxID=1582356 RepID=UPI001FD6BA2D|nr:SGNH/GDSL hydrolase family protein [Sphingomicrobium aestuariivivum]MCJ8191651.1 SGNH/GDSL hydrolase family protein [Sphingomicrobium aestuariivivum]
MTYARVYVIGDSLADSGNALALAYWYDGLPFASLPAGTPLPELGYFEGRFTDGYTFSDLISNKFTGEVSEPTFPFRYEDPWLGIPIAPFEPDPVGNALNFAYGGAQVLKGDEAVLDLSDQVDALQDALDNDIPSDALIIVTLGGNDIRSLVPDNGTITPPSEAYARIDDIIADMLKHLGQLVRDGAVDMLISGVADIGVVPEYDYNRNGVLDPDEQARADAATEYSLYLDFLIRTVVVPDLEARGANVTYAPLTDNVGQLGALSLILPTLAGLYGLDPAELANNFLTYRDLVFFDDIHPTAQVHAIAGSLMMAQMAGTEWIEILPMEAPQALVAGSLDVAGATTTVDVLLVADTDYAFDMLGMSSLGITGSLADPILFLSGAGLSAGDDDSGAGFDAHLAVTVAQSGTYALTLDAVGMVTGDYVLLAAAVGGAAMGRGDSYVVSSSTTLVLEAEGGVGTDVVRASVDYALAGGSEIEVLETANDKGKASIDLTGNGFDQLIQGNAGNNRIDGGGGEDEMFGGRGKDIFVLDGDGVDRILDYGSEDRIDVGTLLSLEAGVDPVSAGYLRIAGGQVEVDLDGGGDEWVAIAEVGVSAATFLYRSGGEVAEVSFGATKGGGGGSKGGGGPKGGRNNLTANSLLASPLGLTAFAVVAMEVADSAESHDTYVMSSPTPQAAELPPLTMATSDVVKFASPVAAESVTVESARSAHGLAETSATLVPVVEEVALPPLPDASDLPMPAEHIAPPDFGDGVMMAAPMTGDADLAAVLVEALVEVDGDPVEALLAALTARSESDAESAMPVVAEADNGIADMMIMPFDPVELALAAPDGAPLA